MIRTYLKSQPILKLLSLGMALFLWFMVRAERKLETNLDVSIELANIPKNLVIAREFDSILQVRVVGPSSKVERLKQDHSNAYRLDLSSAKTGANTFWIHEEDLELPFGVRIVQVVPQVVKIYLDQSLEKQVPVVARFAGQLEYGFEIVSYKVNPPVLKVKGTKSELDGLGKIQTIPVSLDGRRRSFEEIVQLETIEKFLSMQTQTAKVTVEIKENTVTKKFDFIPVVIIPDSQRWQIVPNEVTIYATGLASDLADLSENLEAFVPLTKSEDLSKSTTWVQPKIRSVPKIDFKIVPERLRLVRKKRR
ncbi:MAG: hypothetical protein KDD48_03005 [Bdellovibrionales bacterium]|nr:hypothetical protein [Bdellovibrionales bacterium]